MIVLLGPPYSGWPADVWGLISSVCVLLLNIHIVKPSIQSIPVHLVMLMYILTGRGHLGPGLEKQ